MCFDDGIENRRQSILTLVSCLSIVPFQKKKKNKSGVLYEKLVSETITVVIKSMT